MAIGMYVRSIPTVECVWKSSAAVLSASRVVPGDITTGRFGWIVAAAGTLPSKATAEMTMTGTEVMTGTTTETITVEETQTNLSIAPRKTAIAIIARPTPADGFKW